MEQIYYRARTFDQHLAPTKERVRTWDNDTEFGLALVDRQFDNLFDEVGFFWNRPPHDKTYRNPNQTYQGFLFVRTRNPVVVETPDRTVTMPAGRRIAFVVAMHREQWRSTHHPFRNKKYLVNRFEIGSVKVVTSYMSSLETAELRWRTAGYNSFVEEDSIYATFNGWDCMTNYRGTYGSNLPNGHRIANTQPRFKTLKALAVGGLNILMSQAANGDNFDGGSSERSGMDYARFGITASDDWRGLSPQIEGYELNDEEEEDEFFCPDCDEYVHTDHYGGSHGDYSYCERHWQRNTVGCEWCENVMWAADTNEIIHVHLTGGGGEYTICRDCNFDLYECDVCHLLIDGQNNEVIRTAEGQTMCTECSIKEGMVTCEECNAVHRPGNGHCPMCGHEREVEQCISNESSSSASVG